MNKYNICNNCGKTGHLFHQCKSPITSYGIIAFRYNKGMLQYLMIRRKDTFAYIEFIRGKYISHNKEHIINLIESMTNEEKHKILNESFESLWKIMWGCKSNILQYKREEISSQKKFNIIKQGLMSNGEEIKLDNIIKLTEDKWNEPEWEFPKGRKNYQERDLDCAIREFEEETGYDIDSFMVVENMLPLEEMFIGSNNKCYKHKYYLAFMKSNEDVLENYQKSEVSKIEWKTLEECIECIRPYNSEKVEMIQDVNKIIHDQNIYFSIY